MMPVSTFRPRVRWLAAAIVAVAAATTAHAEEAGGLDRDTRLAVRTACAADYHRYCRSVRPGDGRIAACFRDNADGLSETCRAALLPLLSPLPASPPPG